MRETRVISKAVGTFHLEKEEEKKARKKEKIGRQ